MGQCMSAKSMQRIREEAHSMPSWCLFEDAEYDVKKAELVEDSWRLLMTGTAEPFIEAKKATPSLTPLVFFYNTFYYNFFDYAPEVKPMFKNKLSTQGRMLANIIKFVISNVKDKNGEVFRQSLTGLAIGHNAIGVTAEMYGVMGMCLLHSIRICLGDRLYTLELHKAWVQVYSRMMQIVIPVVVAGTLPSAAPDATAEKNALQTYNQVMRNPVPVTSPLHKIESSPEPSASYTHSRQTSSDGGSREENSSGEGSEETKVEPQDPDLNHKFKPVNYLRPELLAKMDEKGLQILIKEIKSSGLIQDHYYKQQMYPGCLVGCTLVDWLIANRRAGNRATAGLIARQLQDYGLTCYAHPEDPFRDEYIFYTFEVPESVAEIATEDLVQDAMSDDELKSLKNEILNSGLIANQEFQMKKYPECLVGAALVDWLVGKKRAGTRREAVQIGMQLSAVGLKDVHGLANKFKDDYSFFTFNPDVTPVVIEPQDLKKRFKELKRKPAVPNYLQIPGAI